MKHLTILFLFLSNVIVAQQEQSKGSISAIIIDFESKKPLEFCTVSLLKSQDSTVVTGMLTNENGAFNFEQLKLGTYFLKASFVGSEKPFMFDAEINNGRLAMIGSLGMIAQELVSNKPIF